MLVDGDMIATRTTTTGTHAAPLMGIPATGRQIAVGAVDMMRLRDGKAAERWGGLDTYALLRQLGVLPAPGGAH